MNSLDRVRLCFDHKEADRIPIDFGGWLSGIKPQAYRALCDYLGEDVSTWNSYTPSESILQRFEIDFRRITATTPEREKTRQNPDGTTTDRWGITRRFEAGDDQIVDFPLKNASIEDLEEYPFWPDADPEGRYHGLMETARDIHRQGYAVSAQPDICGVFEQSCWLAGFDRMLLDMAVNKDFVHALFERICSLQEQYARNYYGVVGDEVDMIQLGDDFGTQNGPFFSPDMYRELVMPYQKRYHEAIRSQTNARIFHHSCGSVYRILEGMVEAGVQVLNPVQISAAEMDPKTLKKEFGAVLVFHGAIDVQKAIPFMTPEEIRDEIKRVIDILAPGGGYILAPSHNMQEDTPPENVVAMFEAALEFGRY